MVRNNTTIRIFFIRSIFLFSMRRNMPESFAFRKTSPRVPRGFYLYVLLYVCPSVCPFLYLIYILLVLLFIFFIRFLFPSVFIFPVAASHTAAVKSRKQTNSCMRFPQKIPLRLPEENTGGCRLSGCNKLQQRYGICRTLSLPYPSVLPVLSEKLLQQCCPE